MLKNGFSKKKHRGLVDCGPIYCCRWQKQKNADETSIHKKSMVKIIASLEDCFACCTVLLLARSNMTTQNFLLKGSKILCFQERQWKPLGLLMKMISFASFLSNIELMGSRAPLSIMLRSHCKKELRLERFFPFLFILMWPCFKTCFYR